MKLMQRYLVSERLRCLENGVRVNVIGRRDRLAPELVRSIEDLEQMRQAFREKYANREWIEQERELKLDPLFDQAAAPIRKRACSPRISSKAWGSRSSSRIEPAPAA